jgi:hypothetical protein
MAGKQARHQRKNKLRDVKTNEESRAASVEAYKKQISGITAETKEDTADL